MDWRYKKGDLIQGIRLLERTVVRSTNRAAAAWFCKLEDSTLKIVREIELDKRKAGTFRSTEQVLFEKLYRVYKERCRLRNMYWSLTPEEFRALVLQPCVYCGAPPSNRMSHFNKTSKAVFIYTGVDRKNNQKGYERGNVVPACGPCNQIKTSLLTYEEMKAAMAAILRIRKRGRGPRPCPSTSMRRKRR